MTVVTDVLAEGKTKILKRGEAPNELIVTFKDAATAFNGKKYAEIPGKGALNAHISILLFQQVSALGLPTCFVRAGQQPNELVYNRLTMIPLEVVVRNFAYGSLVKRFGMEEGQALVQPIVEFFHKSNDDPLITDDVIRALNLVPDAATLAGIRRMALQINELFVALFEARGIRCADFKLEFGFDADGRLTLGDELSPDNFRLRDATTGAVLDKDVFRLDLGDLAETYAELLHRLEQTSKTVPQTPMLRTYTAEILVQSRKNILNPESKAILEGLHTLGHTGVKQLRAGKRFVLELSALNLVEAEVLARKLAEEVLSNPVIEDYELSVRP
jgi:phosphoribosylaminoimidazole-succinocarboxamide synthase